LKIAPGLESVRPLRQILAGDATLARWAERQQRDQDVLQRARKQLPPALAAQLEAVSAGAQELLLIATSGAAAALLRQRAPALLASLQHGGWKFTVIRVRVQARSARGDRSKLYAKQIDAKAASALRRGAETIADPALAAALRRLAERSASENEDGALERIEREDPEQQK